MPAGCNQGATRFGTSLGERKPVDNRPNPRPACGCWAPRAPPATQQDRSATGRASTPDSSARCLSKARDPGPHGGRKPGNDFRVPPAVGGPSWRWRASPDAVRRGPVRMASLPRATGSHGPLWVIRFIWHLLTPNAFGPDLAGHVSSREPEIRPAEVVARRSARYRRTGLGLAVTVLTARHDAPCTVGCLPARSRARRAPRRARAGWSFL